MKIRVNGQEKEIGGPLSLKQVIEQVCCETSLVIAEVNGKIVRNHRWQDEQLRHGDTIELVSFVGGG